jgi:hypothetical protein
MTANNSAHNPPFEYGFISLLCASLSLICNVQALTAQSNDFSSTLLKCGLKADNNGELLLDYVEATDSTITLFITHNLSGDSLLFEGYSLRGVECVNHSANDTSRTYQSNMLLAQDKRVYAGTSNSYFLKFDISIDASDTIEIHQEPSNGPLRFPPFCLNHFSPIDSIPNDIGYRSEITTGTVAFYTRQRLGDLEVFVDSAYIGTISNSVPKKDPTPDCGDIGLTLVNRRLPSGPHSYRVTNRKFTWEGEFYIIRECCIRIQIEK